MFGIRKKSKENSGEPTLSLSTNSKKNSGDVQSSNRIGQGTKIEGEIITEGTIRIEGEIDGYVESKSRIIIGPTGVIKGDILCESIDISGHVVGKIKCKDILFMKSSAIVDGEIETNKLVMDQGATFNGSCKTKVGSSAGSFLNDKAENNADLTKKAV